MEPSRKVIDLPPNRASYLADFLLPHAEKGRVSLIAWPPRTGKNHAVADFIAAHPESRFIVLGPSIRNVTQAGSGALSTMADYLTKRGVKWHLATGRHKGCRQFGVVGKKGSVQERPAKPKTPSGAEHRFLFARNCGPIAPSELRVCNKIREADQIDPQVAAGVDLATVKRAPPFDETFDLGYCPIEVGRALLRNPPPGQPVLTSPATLRKAWAGLESWPNDLFVIWDEAHKESLFTHLFPAPFTFQWDGTGDPPDVFADLGTGLRGKPKEWAEEPDGAGILEQVERILERLLAAGVESWRSIGNVHSDEAPMGFWDRRDILPGPDYLTAPSGEANGPRRRTIGQTITELEQSLDRGYPALEHRGARAFIINELIPSLRGLEEEKDPTKWQARRAALETDAFIEKMALLYPSPSALEYKRLLSGATFLPGLMRNWLLAGGKTGLGADAFPHELALTRLRAILDEHPKDGSPRLAAVLDLFLEARTGLVVPTVRCVDSERGTFEVQFTVLDAKERQDSSLFPFRLQYGPLARALEHGANVVLLTGTPLSEMELCTRFDVDRIHRIPKPPDAKSPRLVLTVEGNSRSKQAKGGKRADGTRSPVTGTMVGRKLSPGFANLLLAPLLNEIGPETAYLVAQAEDQQLAVLAEMKEGHLQATAEAGLLPSRVRYARDKTSVGVQWDDENDWGPLEGGNVVFLNPPRPPGNVYPALLGLGRIGPDGLHLLYDIGREVLDRNMAQEVIQTGLRTATNQRDGSAILLGGGQAAALVKHYGEQEWGIEVELRWVDPMENKYTDGARGRALGRASRGESQDPLVDAILARLKEGPQRQTALVESVAGTAKQVRTRLERLVAAGRIRLAGRDRNTGAWVYELTPVAQSPIQ